MNNLLSDTFEFRWGRKFSVLGFSVFFLVFLVFLYLIDTVDAQIEPSNGPAQSTTTACTLVQYLTLTTNGLECRPLPELSASTHIHQQYITTIAGGDCISGQYVSGLSVTGVPSCTSLPAVPDFLTRPPICSGTGKALQYTTDGWNCFSEFIPIRLIFLTQALKISDNEGGPGKLDVNLDDFDHFGNAVSLDGNTLVVGAPRDDDGGGDSGSVYIFEQSNNIWSQTLKISDDGGGSGKLDVNLDNFDSFGDAVSLDGNTLAVGVLRDDDGGIDRGAVYIFEKSHNTWSQTLKISDNGGGSGKLDVNLGDSDYFGNAVSLDGGTLVVGAFGSGSGVVYSFEKSNDEWTKKYKFSNGGVGSTDGFTAIDVDLERLLVSEVFGDSVSLDGDTLTVGSYYQSGVGGVNKGVIYIFEKSGGTWVKKYSISDRGEGTIDGLTRINIDSDTAINFGNSVSLDEGSLVVGAYSGGGGGSNKGAAYTFEKSNDTWVKKYKFSDEEAGGIDGFTRVFVDLDSYSFFGTSVALDGNTFVVGAFSDDDGGSNKGAAYLFNF